jgi:putative transposase
VCRGIISSVIGLPFYNENGGLRRLSDEQARMEIRKRLGTVEIAQVKSLPKMKRNELLKKVKEIDGLSLRQVARILGIS